jgi:hypothetical protein
VIVVTRFRLLEGTDESDFREGDARYQMEFAYQQPGLLRRTTAVSEDGEWVVLELWRDPRDAENSRHRATTDRVAREHAALIDGSTIEVGRFRELDA